MEIDYKDRVNDYWSSRVRKEKERNSWWDSSQVIRHINKTICGKELDGWNKGPVELLMKILPEDYQLANAVSVGCGLAKKEMDLLEWGVVDHFLCFDLAEKRIEEAKKLAIQRGLQNKIDFVCEDFFVSDLLASDYDFVFWDNSLHHMPNSMVAVRKSYEILKKGGIFFCNDFVGKNRFQWTDMQIAIVNGIRMMLPDSIFAAGNGMCHSRLVSSPSLEEMIKLDPSEAADSEAIIPAIRNVFEEPLIIPTGGLIYFLGLEGIIRNIPEDSKLLEYLLTLDDETIRMGITLYAFALGIK